MTLPLCSWHSTVYKKSQKWFTDYFSQREETRTRLQSFTKNLQLPMQPGPRHRIKPPGWAWVSTWRDSRLYCTYSCSCTRALALLPACYWFIALRVKPRPPTYPWISPDSNLKAQYEVSGCRFKFLCASRAPLNRTGITSSRIECTVWSCIRWLPRPAEPGRTSDAWMKLMLHLCERSGAVVKKKKSHHQTT